jgi:hypothetical protein
MSYDLDALIREVDELPNTERSLLDHNTRELVNFCRRLVVPLREMQRTPWPGMAQDQGRIVAWIEDRFGVGSALDLCERADRLLEEAIEAQQAAYADAGAKHGFSPGCERAMDLVGHVYSKPPGDPAQEMGGVITCALAMAHRLNVRLDEAARFELDRIEGLSKEHFDKRHQAKVDAGVAAQHVRPGAAEGRAP